MFKLNKLIAIAVFALGASFGGTASAETTDIIATDSTQKSEITMMDQSEVPNISIDDLSAPLQPGDIVEADQDSITELSLDELEGYITQVQNGQALPRCPRCRVVQTRRCRTSGVACPRRCRINGRVFSCGSRR